jgi:hypothetical protein
VELGAAWIHGRQGNPITALAAREGLLVEPSSHRAALVDAEGRVHDDVDEQLSRFDAVVERARGEAQPEGREREDVPDRSVAQAVLDLPDASIPRRTLELGLRWHTLILGTELDRLSLRAWNHDDDLPGGDGVLPGGYDGVVKALARGADVRLEHCVERIDWNARPLRVHTNRGLLLAHAVLVTVSLGVLQAEAIELSPSLPPWKQRAQRALGMGCLDKVILRFDARVALGTRRPGAALDLGRWLADPSGPEHLVLDGPAEGPTTLTRLPPAQGPGVIAWQAGRAARSAEELPDGQRVEAALAVLRRVFGPDVPAPAAAHATAWHRDPLARGAYSHVPVGGSPRAYDELAAPLASGRLRFAGEATHRRHAATVHGAIESGWREAHALDRRK